MNSQLLLGLDIGTTGVKGILITESGETVSTAFAGYVLSTPKPNWAEQDPEDWWKATVDVIGKLLMQSGRTGDQIQGIGLSGQMHSLVLLDKDARVLRPRFSGATHEPTKNAAGSTRRSGVRTYGRWSQIRRLKDSLFPRSSGCETTSHFCMNRFTRFSFRKITFASG